MPYLYFAVSRCTINKDILYAKFGYCRNEKDRMLSYNSHNPSYEYSIVYYNSKVFDNKPLDNYIYENVLLRKAIPLVDFKYSEDSKRLTDWFEIQAESVTSYMNELKRIPDKHFCRKVKRLLDVFSLR